MSAAAISAQDRWRASMEQYFSQGNQTLNNLVTRLGGNASADPAVLLSGDAGVPTTGNFTPTWLPPLSTRGRTPGGGSRSNGSKRVLPACNFPEVLPLLTVFPVPVAVQPAPRPAPPPPVAPLPVPAPAPPPVRAPAANCRTGNVCLDIANGCIRSDQVSPEQLFACSQAGYAGNRDLYANNPPGFFGSPNLAPAPFSPDMLPRSVGVSGTDVLTGGAGSGVFWGSLALGVFSLWAAREFAKAPVRRRS